MSSSHPLASLLPRSCVPEHPVVHGPVTARGGKGGRGVGWGSRGGGGGGGGRIAGFAQSLSLVQGGVVDVSGGQGGLDNQLVNGTMRGPAPDFAPVELYVVHCVREAGQPVVES
jgi:hypothetical protein